MHVLYGFPRKQSLTRRLIRLDPELLARVEADKAKQFGVIASNILFGLAEVARRIKSAFP